MMKKKIVIIILLMLIVISATSLFVLFRINQKIDLLKTTFEFEYGEVIDLKAENGRTLASSIYWTNGS